MNKIIIIITIAILYFIIYTICCIPMAIVTSKTLDVVNVDNQIGVCEVKDKPYHHAVIVVNNKSYEPRFLGLYRQDHIDYNPIKFYTSDELLEKKEIWPDTPFLMWLVKDYFKGVYHGSTP